MIIVNSFLPLTIITKRSILDVGAVLDPPLINSPSNQRSRLHAIENNIRCRSFVAIIDAYGLDIMVDK